MQQCWNPPQGHSQGKFVTKCAETVLERLKFGYVADRPTIRGSRCQHGGAAARRQLQVDKNQDHHLRASIYVPSKDKVKDADITHLMAVGDVALRCNRLKSVATRPVARVPVSDDKKLIQKTNMYIGFLWTGEPEVESAHA
jgi:hypothetical protein